MFTIQLKEIDCTEWELSGVNLSVNAIRQTKELFSSNPLNTHSLSLTNALLGLDQVKTLSEDILAISPVLTQLVHSLLKVIES